MTHYFVRTFNMDLHVMTVARFDRAREARRHARQQSVGGVDPWFVYEGSRRIATYLKGRSLGAEPGDGK